MGSLRVRDAARGVLMAVLIVSAAGCQSMKDTVAEMSTVGSGFDAPIRPLGGSTATGVAKLTQTSNGVALMVHVAGLREGGMYRVVIHANGNCTSRNGFSAGPPWQPAGASDRTLSQLRSVAGVHDGTLTSVVRIPGVQLDGPDSLNGKSVVIHYGAQGSLDAQPGIDNERVACGVIGPPG